MERQTGEKRKQQKYGHKLIVLTLCCGAWLVACGNTESAASDGFDSASVADSGITGREDLSESLSAGALGDTATAPTETPEPSFDLNWFLGLPMVSELSPEKQEVALRLYEDGVLEGGVTGLKSLLVEDMDGNGQFDCVAMLCHEGDIYGHGCVYIYMNEEEPYRFYDEAWPYYVGADVQWTDLTGDGRLEIILETVGSGNGAAGDHYVAVVSDTGNGIKELEFPLIPEKKEMEDYPEIQVDVYMEAEENTYSAYCPYLEDRITFESPWTDYGQSREVTEPIPVGGNVRGFFHPVCEEKDGKNRLIVWEYLSGEGGIVHCVGLACFAIEWDEDGTSRIREWWIEPVETYSEWFWNDFVPKLE